MTKAQHIEWCAGFFEGEGWVCITRRQTNTGNVRHRLHCGITNTELALLEIFANNFGGSIRPCKGSALSKKPLWRWECYDSTAQAFLEVLLPHLRGLKGYAATQALLLRSRMRSDRKHRGKDGKIAPLSSEEVAVRDSIVIQMRAHTKKAVIAEAEGK